jgi:hypothetical protein
MINKTDKIKELKEKYPSLTKGINDSVVEVSDKEYNEIINLWAENEIAEEKEKFANQELLQSKVSAYQKLGLTPAEIEALLPTPAEPIA